MATGSGNQTLTVTPSGAPRALSAHAFLIQGFDTTTPIANSGGVNNYSGTVTALTSPNGVTTAASGNVIIGAVSIHSGGVTGISVATADGSSVGNNGTNTFNDNSWGVAWKETTPAASVTFAWTWTSAQRCGAAWVEINAATGGGGASVTTGAGSVTVQGHAPTAGAGVSATPGTGSITVQGYAPTVATGGEATATPGTGALTLQGHAPTATAGVTAATGTGSITVQGYAPTVSDGSVAETQPGGWLPIKYVDRDGNVVDLDAVEEAIEEIAEQAPPKRRADLTRVSARVLAMLARDETPRRDDVRLLRRALAEREAALMALNAALLGQQLLDDEITVLLLAA